MPRYRITEYRGLNLVGKTASGTSVIHAKGIGTARLAATCFNTPKGEWRIQNGKHYKGTQFQGNMSVVEPLKEGEQNVR